MLVDLVDDAPVAGVQAGLVTRRLDELDPRTDGHPGTNPSCEESCTLRIHMTHIGFEGDELYPLDRVTAGVVGAPQKSRRSRRIVPNSTA